MRIPGVGTEAVYGRDSQVLWFRKGKTVAYVSAVFYGPDIDKRVLQSRIIRLARLAARRI